MRDGEAVDVNVADDEARAGLEELEDGLKFAPGDGGRGEAAAVNGDAEFFRDGGKAGDVIGMLVGDEDGGEGFRVDVDGGEALEGFLAGEASVDEDASAIGRDESRITVGG